MEKLALRLINGEGYPSYKISSSLLTILIRESAVIIKRKLGLKHFKRNSKIGIHVVINFHRFEGDWDEKFSFYIKYMDLKKDFDFKCKKHKREFAKNHGQHMTILNELELRYYKINKVPFNPESIITLKDFKWTTEGCRDPENDRS